jgi:5S rRNA maturation endonuclease (ribonuclease M5)
MASHLEGNKMARSYIIVESKNDKAALEAILRHMAMAGEVEVGFSEDIIDWDFQSAEDLETPVGLTKKLRSFFNDIAQEKYDNVAIVWDADTFGTDGRMQQINNAIQAAAEIFRGEQPHSIIQISGQIRSQDQFMTLEIGSGKVRLGVHIVGKNDQGEIEDLLKEIANRPSPIADCINSLLPGCMLSHSGEAIREKDLVKLWINHYQRFDTLKKKKERIEQNTSYEGMLRREIFDFGRADVAELVELKRFLASLLMF